MLFELDGVALHLEPGAWVAPNAAVIGNVWLGLSQPASVRDPACAV